MTPCIICDIDGTIADTRHRLHFITSTPKNWKGFFDAMGDDTPYQYLIDLLQKLHESTPIVLTTGRPDSHKVLTETWLEKYCVPHDTMLMRKTKDFRPDTVVKKEMLTTLRKDYIPTLAIDDRPDVVQMWRNNDVPCLSVDATPWFAPPKKDADNIEWLEWLAKQHHDDRFANVADELRQLRSKLDLAERALGKNDD